MQRIYVATGNAHKVEELRALLGVSEVCWESLASLEGYELPEETGNTFAANAAIKAEACALHTGAWALADDSGLVVDALGGAPGIRSARFAGLGSDDQRNLERLLVDMQHVPVGRRRATFECCLALARPGEATIVVSGRCVGELAAAPRGNAGFGYDPIFLPAAWPGRSMAELSAEEKHQCSHRGQAARAMRAVLQQYLSLM